MNPFIFGLQIPAGSIVCPDFRVMEFHVNKKIREACNFDETLFASTGNVLFTNIRAVQLFVQKYNKIVDGTNHPERYLKSGQLNAMGLIDEIFHFVCRQYRLQVKKTFFEEALSAVEQSVGKQSVYTLLETFTTEFPPMEIYRGKTDVQTWLAGSDADGTTNAVRALEEMLLLCLANENPAFEPFFPLFSDTGLKAIPAYAQAWEVLRSFSSKNAPFGPEGRDLVSMLKAPVEYSPYDLKGQLDYIRTRWASLLGDWLARLLAGLDLIAEEEKPGWVGGIGSGTPDMNAYEFGDISKEYERFSPDRDWMPNVVLMAKSALVWLSQLSAKYQRSITRLDQIPDEELDFLADAGFTGLWLIGVWERSPASARIKQICGNPEAAASAYSLDDYEIAGELGGWDALDNLRARAWKRGIRLASDMVPNHTGLDARMVIEKPDLFIQTHDCPFPGYDFTGENLSHDERVGVYLENHYYTKSDCAVVFKRVDHYTGDVRYIYHGNDGTGMPWNDTAQVDFLNPAAREEVIQKILHVARNFPIIRFDAAMVLAKKHIQRLWYPEPGHGGDIASRSQHAISREEFERRIPEEFWREVVDRCAEEVPDTLLLAEAFWMMEGYFVRTLGMHRVYNSAFMNMLKREDNEKYRTTIKNTIEFEPEILKRYVNFMNNPDEETAVAQFGRGDKYFGVCTMMVAMPGLPMFGHGQLEGFEEKYGMEYRRAYRDEQIDQELLNRHRREIFPLMKKRWLFAGSDNFRLYDFWENGHVNENVFAWSNRAGNERALILYNNVYQRAVGWIKSSAAFLKKNPDGSKTLVQQNLAEGLALSVRDNRFCIMQEQRSGLWFIRTTREFAETGLFAVLNGFQTQVFLNMYEVDDDEHNRYRMLYESLNGSGITDVFMGIQNIFLKDLYTALSAFASPAFFHGITELQNSKDSTHTSSDVHSSEVVWSEKIRDFIASHKTAGLAFFAECEKFIEGDFGASTLPGMSKRGKPIPAVSIWAEFAFSLERLLSLPLFIKNPPSELQPAAIKLLKTLHTELFSLSDMAEISAAALILNTLRSLTGTKTPGTTTQAVIKLWSLDRKMADIMSGYGLNGGHARDAFRKMDVLLPITDPIKGPKQKRINTSIAQLFSQETVRRILQVHTWDNTEWFNKEQAENLLNVAIGMIILEQRETNQKDNNDSDTEMYIWNKNLARLSQTRKQLLARIIKSDYQVEKFTQPKKTSSQ